MKRRTKIQRLKEIAEILFEHGLIDFIEELGLSSFLSPSRLEQAFEKKVGEVNAEDIRYLFEDLGPTFVKLGQFLAMRPDLIPSEFAQELHKLYEQATPFSASESKRIIEEELGNINEIFDEFYNQPLAAASIGQVHDAVLKNGEEVVVKVQRPNIREKATADMELIEKIAQLIEKHIPESEIYHPHETIREFKNMLKREMDYTIEARNAQRFYDAFKDDETLTIPKVYWEYVTDKVLILERIEGKSLRIAINEEYPKELKKELATKMAQAMLKQFFIHGIFHADPSPGNIYFREDGTLSLLDFGAIGRLSETRRNQLIDIFLAMAKDDTKKVMDVLLEMGKIHGPFDKNELEWDIENILQIYKRKPDILLKEGANEEVIQIAKKHNISLPPNYLLMERSLVETEGVCKSLDADFDFFKAAKPVITEVIKNRYGPKAQVDQIVKSLFGYKNLLSNLPDRINNILKSVEDEEFSMVIEHKGLDSFEQRMEVISNRLSFTIILAAIIIGSSLIVLATGEEMFGPYIFLVAVLIGLWLIAIIVKRGKY